MIALNLAAVHSDKPLNHSVEMLVLGLLLAVNLNV